MLSKSINRAKPTKEEEKKANPLANINSIWDWFKEWMFYQYGLVYMGARMQNNRELKRRSRVTKHASRPTTQVSMRLLPRLMVGIQRRLGAGLQLHVRRGG